MESLLFPLVMVALMWLLLIRPQQQRVKQHRALLARLEVGTEVVTAGGIVGRIVALEGELASLEVAPGTVLRVLRTAISGTVNPAGLDEGADGAGANVDVDRIDLDGDGDTSPRGGDKQGDDDGPPGGSKPSGRD